MNAALLLSDENKTHVQSLCRPSPPPLADLTSEHGGVDLVVEGADDVLIHLRRRPLLLLLLRVPHRLDPAVVLMDRRWGGGESSSGW